MVFVNFVDDDAEMVKTIQTADRQLLVEQIQYNDSLNIYRELSSTTYEKKYKPIR
jgi:hypothetical protein